ncbi:hypothetical protein CIB48_g7497 [Xylaria polymorpha]|nr:hypothetical protein CIB48_g7497 [Xylaria polymorpha]
MSTPADTNTTTTDPWDKETKRKFQNKSASEYFDPCQEAATKSIRCLNRNGGDRAMCTDYFEAYRACKKEWVSARVPSGIVPVVLFGTVVLQHFTAFHSMFFTALKREDTTMEMEMEGGREVPLPYRALTACRNSPNAFIEPANRD